MGWPMMIEALRWPWPPMPLPKGSAEGIENAGDPAENVGMRRSRRIGIDPLAQAVVHHLDGDALAGEPDLIEPRGVSAGRADIRTRGVGDIGDRHAGALAQKLVLNKGLDPEYRVHFGERLDLRGGGIGGPGFKIFPDRLRQGTPQRLEGGADFLLARRYKAN